MIKTLTASMDNLHASRLGQIALAAGEVGRPDVGDAIDRGLILLKMLSAAGFIVQADDSIPHVPVQDVIAAHRRQPMTWQGQPTTLENMDREMGYVRPAGAI